jgi:hypothetical protein
MGGAPGMDMSIEAPMSQRVDIRQRLMRRGSGHYHKQELAKQPIGTVG